MARPFEAGTVRYFPATITRSEPRKGKVAAYADVRAYMDRLDDVLGPGGWSTSYRCIDPSEKAVECTLSLLIDGAWVSKADVGYPNDARDVDQPEKEAWKAAYSDALKRAAVQHGVGRYLYHLEFEQDWLPVDEYGRFKEQPRIKGSAPATQPQSAPPANTPASPATAGRSGLRGSLKPAEADQLSRERYGRPFSELSIAERRELFASVGAGS